MSTYYDDPVKDRAVKRYLRSLRRRITAPQRHEKLLALDGPFAGQTLRLSASLGPWDCCTAVIRVGNQVGRYVAKKASETNYWRDGYALVWEPQS